MHLPWTHLRSCHVRTMDSLRSGLVRTMDSLRSGHVPRTHWDLVMHLTWTHLKSGHVPTMDTLRLFMHLPWARLAWPCMYHGLTELGHVCTMDSLSMVMYHGLTELGHVCTMDSLSLAMYVPWTH